MMIAGLHSKLALRILRLGIYDTTACSKKYMKLAFTREYRIQSFKVDSRKAFHLQQRLETSFKSHIYSSTWTS